MSRDTGGEPPEPPADPGIAGLMNSFSLDSSRPRRRGRGEQQEPEPPQRQAEPAPRPPAPEVPASVPQPPAFEGELEDPATLVRPYTWTGGRTRSTLCLELETLVSSNEQAVSAQPALSREHRIIAALCRHPHSVAEVAAKLAVPLGVARVLLSDMSEQNLINVYTSPAGTDRAAHFTVMERVLSGLRRL